MRHDSFIEFEFRRNRGIGSALIGWFGNDYWSHVDVVVPHGLIGARYDNPGGHGRGVQLRPFDYETPKDKMRLRAPCTQWGRECALIFLSKQVGKPYDWRVILAFAANRNWREEDAWICSELASRVLEIARNKRLSLAVNKITPGALALAVSATA